MTRPLTAKLVEYAKPGPTRREIPDGGSGLYLVIQPSGTKSWAFRYRWQGQPRKLTIGPLSVYGLADARDKVRAMLEALDENRDPSAAKATVKAITTALPDTVRAVGEVFVEQWHRPRNRLKTASEAERILRTHVYPAIGHKLIGHVTRREVRRILEGVPGVASNRVLAVVRKLFNWAVAHDYLPASPVVGIQPLRREIARDRVLSDDELFAFLRATRRLTPPFGALFELMLLTGQRESEVANAPWAEFDLERAMWTLPAARAKNGTIHEVPLSARAVALIEGLPSRGKSELLFPAVRVRREKRDGPRAVSGFSKQKAQLDTRMERTVRALARVRGTDGAKLPHWILHDLRRTAASGMARLNVPVHVVEKMLNHKSGKISGIAAVYNRYEYLDERRAAADAWAAYLDRIERGPEGSAPAQRRVPRSEPAAEMAQPDNVIQLRR